jgi:hypothetical protein
VGIVSTTGPPGEVCCGGGATGELEDDWGFPLPASAAAVEREAAPKTPVFEEEGEVGPGADWVSVVVVVVAAAPCGNHG